MCSECNESSFKDNITGFIFSFRVHKITGLLHCLTHPSNMDSDWFINGDYIEVDNQEEFEKSIEYRMWKLKAFK